MLCLLLRTISAAVSNAAKATSLVQEEEPIWHSLVTRHIGLKTPEGRSPKAISARDKELSGHWRRGTWDETTVREYKELMKDPAKSEVMRGRVFGILGMKNEQLPESEQELKFRAVIQGTTFAQNRCLRNRPL